MTYAQAYAKGLPISVQNLTCSAYVRRCRTEMKISGLSYLSIIPNSNNNNILYEIIFEPIFFDNSLTFTQRYEMGKGWARLHELSVDMSGGGKCAMGKWEKFWKTNVPIKSQCPM